MSDRPTSPDSQASNDSSSPNGEGVQKSTAARKPWWKSIGPALIVACVVFGPGSLLISSKVGATFEYQMIWGLILAGILMGNFLMMGARIGVVGGRTPCTLLADDLGRPVAALVGLSLALICAAFQFCNNQAVIMAAEAFFPENKILSTTILVLFNLAIIIFLFTAKELYKVIERVMKVMVGLILACFLFNLFCAKPNLADVASGFVPSLPDIWGNSGHLLLIASMLGTTCSMAGAFFQGNLVRERGWTIDDFRGSVGDSIAGVTILTGISLIIMITAATVIPGKPANNVVDFANSLKPLLGSTSYWVFSIGLVAVSMNPFLINAMIGGAAAADGLGLPPKFGDRWPRIFTVLVMLLGMGVALGSRFTSFDPLKLLIFGQAMTVLGGPLMAISLLWLGNRKKYMGEYRNRWLSNTLGALGLIVILAVAVKVVFKILIRTGG
jgi:manganese transport protein